jgi:hypothetical protein
MDKDGYIAVRLFISKYLCIDASLSQGQEILLLFRNHVRG